MLEFSNCFLGVDIWKDVDTKTGTTKYIIYFGGKEYSRDTEIDIFALIEQLFNKMKVDSHTR